MPENDRRYRWRGKCADCGKRRVVAPYHALRWRNLCAACQRYEEARLNALFPSWGLSKESA